MSEEQRISWVKETILSLKKTYDHFNEQALLKKGQDLKRLQKELNQIMPRLLSTLMYAVKPEYRIAWMQLLGSFQGVNLSDNEFKYYDGTPVLDQP